MERRRVVVSAPGKVILFGEHSVVHGKLAVAAAIDKRLFISLEESNENTIAIKLEGFEREDKTVVLSTALLLSFSEKLFENLVAIEWRMKDTSNDLSQPPSFLSSSFQDFLAQQGNVDSWMKNVEQYLESHSSYLSASSAIRSAVFLFVVCYLIILVYPRQTESTRGLLVTVQSQIPVGAGLGSSASFSVALITSLLVLAGDIQLQQLSEDISGTLKESINRWAFLCETFLHGTPSGMDNTIATFGGFLSYRNGKKETFQVHSDILRFIVVDSGVPRSTQKMVSKVYQRYQEFPEIVSPILISMDEIAIRFIQSAVSNLVGDSFSQQLATLMKINHYLLNALGVGHPLLEDIISIAQELGFEGAKLTGAGGGGCAIILVDSGKSIEHVDTLLNTLQSTPHGYRCFEIVLGGSGVQIHHQTN
ncbi:Putative mevalonate kinase [Galdieria sulphuraria]|uniref:Mevalonate kinase n=1 Tax=Galdieria sulphuraria TaxID=130081 RepID=M2Y357_GALSU|nr:mevalonate kinase [Galdieria sulphuraria]EME30254.1 mevalonate kinase [Galdieria sulphuraria]GJD08420.1 Putative mevalonate kinase [Galdieria sulphuraria]|eukprot:XP_005706774.1 mevalonate kinase [Galdieria sulphuraria]